MAETLNVKIRKSRGTSHARRERRNGRIPAILYGHGQDSASLSLGKEELEALIRHGTRIVDLVGDVSDKALLREVQWDPFGLSVLHVDLTRVSATERVEVTLPIELRGEAPGSREGGIVEQQLHEATISCRAEAIPERLEVSVKALGLGESLLASAIGLPPGAELVTSPDELVVQCNAPLAMPEEAAEELVGGEGVEPEIIRRKEEEESGD